ncbi:MAG TPA: hypothetical protein VKM54_25630 [Myxococcota bacterium]|nr:hypothetical protein [Myxococcota bacterium]
MSALLRGWILAASARALAPCTLGGTPGGAGALGQLRLVPHAVTPGWASDPLHGDRDPRAVAFVDSGHPGFAVVPAEVPPSPAGHAALTIHDAPSRVVLAAPRDLASGHPGLRARHPWFPPAAQALGVTAGSATSVDIEMGVARAAEDADAAY